MKRDRTGPPWPFPIRLLLPVVAAGLLWLATLPISPQTIVIPLGAEGSINEYGEGRHLYNFLGWGLPEYLGERLARRAGQSASFLIPQAYRLGSPLRVSILACGCGITNAVDLTINNERFAVPTTDEWRRYTLYLPQRPSIYGQDVYLQWLSAGHLGPLVHQVAVSSHTPDGAMESIGWMALSVAIIVLLMRHEPALVSTIRWVALVAGGGVVAMLLYEPQLLPRASLFMMGSVAAVVLTAMRLNEARRVMLWLLLLWVLATPQLFGTWFLDDAFISFRYARNLVQGVGLTFNPGDVVEGYTNFLWTILVAGFMALGFEPVVTAQVLCTIISLATLLVSYRLAEAWWGGRWWCGLPPLLLAVNAPFLLYTARGSGMETALVTLLALVALWRIWQAHTIRTGGLAGLVCALVMATRPDGALVVAAGVGGLVLAGFTGMSLHRCQKHGRSACLRVALGVLLGFLALYGPYFLWRYWYYGYLLPNTFYAKVGATLPQLVRGGQYTGNFFWNAGLGPLFVFLGVSLIRVLRGRYSTHPPAGPAAFLWLYLVLTIGYVVAVGGDQFPFGRFFIPVLPALAFLLTDGIVALWDLLPSVRWPWLRRGRIPIVGGVVLLLIAYGQQIPATDSRIAEQPVWVEKKVALKGAEQGYWLLRNTPPDAVVATGIAGALPYYSNRYTIDMLGLNDTHIAHLSVATMGQGIAGTEKTDVAYVLRRQPDYIPLSTTGLLQAVPRFQREYALIEVPGPKGGTLSFYRRIGTEH